MLTCPVLAVSSCLHLVPCLCLSLFELQEMSDRLRQDEWIDEWVEGRREIQLGSVLYFVRHVPLSTGCVHLAVELESRPPPPFGRLDGIACWDLRNKLETPRRTLKRVITTEAVSTSFNSQPPSEITIRNIHFQHLKTLRCEAENSQKLWFLVYWNGSRLSSSYKYSTYSNCLIIRMLNDAD